MSIKLDLYGAEHPDLFWDKRFIAENGLVFTTNPFPYSHPEWQKWWDRYLCQHCGVSIGSHYERYYEYGFGSNYEGALWCDIDKSMAGERPRYYVAHPPILIEITAALRRLDEI